MSENFTFHRSFTQKTSKWLQVLLALVFMASLIGMQPVKPVQAAGTVSLTTPGLAYTENFDTLANTGTSSTTPTGWYLYETGTGANTSYTASDGSTSVGDTYSFGTGTSTERAFGSMYQTAVVPIIGASFTNNTGLTIIGLEISYTGEQWRYGGTTSSNDRMDFQYSLNATSLSTGTWTDMNALDFSSRVTSGTARALDGNAAANRLALSSSISGISITNGSTFWIRWNDYNISGTDDQLSVDDFSLTATVPSDDTTAGTATATATGLTTIAVSMPYSNDSNGDNTYTVDYKLTADSSWTIWVSGAAHFASPYTTTITGLAPATSYDIQVTYNDPDGVTGTNPQTIAGVTTYYTLTANNDGNGSVALDPAGGSYAPGTVVTLTATGNEGYIFDSWSGDLAGSINPTTITMDGDKTVTANFTVAVCQTANLTVVADSYMNSGTTRAAYNYGGAPTIQLNPYYQGGTSDQFRAPLLKWDISEIPVDAIVTDASLTFYVTTGETAYAYSLYDLKRTWIEGTSNDAASTNSVTWNTYNGVNSWGTVGAANTSSDRNNTNLWNAIAADFGGTGLQTFHLNANGKAVIQNWVAGSLDNFGLTIQNYSGTSTGSWIAASRENTSGYLAPTLNVTYCVAASGPTITTSGIMTDFSAPVGVNSTEQSYSVTGVLLSEGISVSAPADFLISTTSGGPYASTATLDAAGGTVYVIFNRSSVGTSSGDISHESNGAESKMVAVSGTAGDPAITVSTSSLPEFIQRIGTPSTEKTYTISGTFLKGDIIVTAPVNFEISKTSDDGFTSSLTFTPTNYTLATTTIYVRLNRSTVGDSSGDITHASLDATTRNVAVSGTTTVVPTTVTFQEGVAGYAGTADTTIKYSTPTDSYGTQTYFEWDTQEGTGDTPETGLLQFNNIFGSDAGQIPLGSTITSASLTYRIYSNTNSNGDSASVYESLVSWDEATTYNTFGDEVGVQSDDYNSTLVATALATAYNTNYTIDVTTSLQRWLSGTDNFGWVFLAVNTNGVEVHSSEATTQDYRPLLTVSYIPPSGPSITTIGTLTPFSSSPGVPSSEQTYTVSGSNLTADISISAPTGFEIQTGAGDFGPSLTLTPDGEGSVAATTIAVRLHSSSEGPLSGNITHSSPDATTRNVAVSGTVTSLSPDLPVLVAPTDDATGIVTPPALQVGVSDPDSATVDVSFYGRPAGGSAEDFTLIVMPDTQRYADTSYPDRYATFNTMTQWIATHAESDNIVFVTHVGDIVENNTDGGWVVADAAYDTLDTPGIPYSLSIGNNDFDGDPTFTKFETNFGISRFTGKSWYGGHYGSNNVNSYSLFSASGMDFIVINVNYNPSAAELDWADGILKANPTRRAIVVSHNQLNLDDSWSNDDLFTALQDNPNLFLMLSGHLSAAADGSAKRTDPGSPGGQTIYSTLQDYQTWSNANNGYLRIYRFSPADDKIYMTTYSPTLDVNETSDADGTLTLAYSMPDGAAYQLIGTNTGVVSGTNTSISWSGLSDETEYEWYVTVTDGSTTTTGPVWSFTTSAANIAPVLGAIGDKSIAELATLSFTATATDDGLPSGTLTYSLTAGSGRAISVGAYIDPDTGAFSWTPTETDGPGSYPYTVCVSDGTLNDCETITVTVSEVNVAPLLDTIGAQTIAELVSLEFTATATDADLPANTLTFSLDAGTSGEIPTDAIITSGGGFSWTPSEAQGPGEYTFDVCVSDDALSDCETITVTVSEVNVAPELGAIGDKSIAELATLSFTASATDADLPANTLTYSLTTGSGRSSVGAYIDPDTGAFSWTPIEEDGPGSYPYTVCASDGTLSDCETITVTVSEVNVAPVLDTIGAQTIAELVSLEFTATATDADLPANTLTFSLDAGTGGEVPTDASITSGGDFSWIPSEAQGPGEYTFDVCVSDGALSDCETITVTVSEVNVAPVAVDDAFSTTRNIDLVLTGAQLTANDTDADIPAAALSVTAVSNPSNGTVSLASASITFTPTAGFIGTAGFDYTLSDGALTDTGHVTVTVTAETSFLLSVSREGSGTGSVTSSPDGIDCGSTCSASFDTASEVTLTATADLTSTFIGWSGACSGTGTCVVTMDATKSVTATFSLNVHSIDLQVGWNLVSFNLHPTSTAVADVLSSIDGHFDLVYAWDASGAHSGAGNWLKYDNIPASIDSLQTLDETMGFWIHMTAADTLTILGSQPSTTSISLDTAAGGWNLVGYPSATNGLLPGALEDHGVEDYTLVYAYFASDTADPWKLFDPKAGSWANDLTHMLPGWGYWILVTEAATWQVAY